MRLLHFVRRHPIALLGLFAVAFAVWVCRDFLPTDPPPRTPPADLSSVKIDAPDPDWTAPPRRIPMPPGIEDQLKAKPGTAQALSKLKPGMTRVEVEGLVGTPAPNDILPATVADGRVTYQT